MCFFGPIGKPWTLICWDIFVFFLEPMNRVQRNLTGRNILTSSTKFVFFGPIGTLRWPPRPLICWHIFDFVSATAERNYTKLDRKQDLNVLYQDCVLRGLSETKDGHTVLWLAEIISNLSQQPLNGFQRNLEAWSQRHLPSFPGWSFISNCFIPNWGTQVHDCRRLNNIPDFEATLLKWGCQWNGNNPIKNRNITVYKSYQKHKKRTIWHEILSVQ